jgi:hypothetical protein
MRLIDFDLDAATEAFVAKSAEGFAAAIAPLGARLECDDGGTADRFVDARARPGLRIAWHGSPELSRPIRP